MLTKSSSPFSNIELAPADPILGIKHAFLRDKRVQKADLSVGVYQNDQGKTPNLRVVKEALGRVLGGEDNAGYLPIDGYPAFTAEIKQLVFGQDSMALKENRVATVQSLGGTGALRYGADFLHKHLPQSAIYVSSPTWANHNAIFSSAGIEVRSYAYLNKENYGLDFEKMCKDLSLLPERSIVLLHAACHNPTGVDPTTEQWREIIEVLKSRNSIPFLDFAYQGFATDVETDRAVVEEFVRSGMYFLVAQSCSKNFSMYRRRVGSLSIIAADEDEASRVLSQLKVAIRTNNSNPPYEGGAAVGLILSDLELRAQWLSELEEMRNRIKHMRTSFVNMLEQKGLGSEFQHMLQQNGMFSYSGLTKANVEALKERHAVYLVDSGRICLAALTSSNLEFVVDGIEDVLKNK